MTDLDDNKEDLTDKFYVNTGKDIMKIKSIFDKLVEKIDNIKRGNKNDDDFDELYHIIHQNESNNDPTDDDTDNETDDTNTDDDTDEEIRNVELQLSRRRIQRSGRRIQLTNIARRVARIEARRQEAREARGAIDDDTSDDDITEMTTIELNERMRWLLRQSTTRGTRERRQWLRRQERQGRDDISRRWRGRDERRRR